MNHAEGTMLKGEEKFSDVIYLHFKGALLICLST